MNQLSRVNQFLLTCTIVLSTNELTTAQPSLLAELHTFGNCFDCQPMNMPYGIGFVIPQAGGGGGNWMLTANIPDVGSTFNAPNDLLAGFNIALAYNGFILGEMGCCHGSGGSITTDGLTNGTQQERVKITRHAPVLGLNFAGYHITSLTMTIDELAWTPISSTRFRGDTTFTARIYGVPIPPSLGDFNVNGTVDAADFALWKKSVETHDLMPNGVGSGLFEGRAVAEDYDVWRAHFGETVIPSGAGLTYSVPEPATVFLVAVAFGVWAFRRQG